MFITRGWFYEGEPLKISNVGKIILVKEGYREDSPKKEVTPIDIYQERVNGWFLGIGQGIVQNDVNAGFVAFMVAIAFFEGHARFRYGVSTKPRGASSEYFKKCFCDVFQPDVSELDVYIEPFPKSQPEKKVILEEAANFIYENARNGLFHDSMTRPHIGLTGEIPTAIAIYHAKSKVNKVHFNVGRFLETIRTYFDSYIDDLRNPVNVELRNAFIRGWNLYR